MLRGRSGEGVGCVRGEVGKGEGRGGSVRGGVRGEAEGARVCM